MEKLGIALISLLNNSWAEKEIIEGKSSMDCVKEQISAFPDAYIHHFIKEGQSQYQDFYENTSTVKNEIYPFLEECLNIFKNCEHILFIYTDSPLNDSNLLKDLLDLHINEMVEYTFNENHPEAIGAEVLDYPTLKKIKNIASGNNEPFNRKSISKIIHFDINQYDVEVLISNRDCRKERLSLISDSKRNHLIIQKAMKIMKSQSLKNNIQAIYQLIDRHPEFMRSLPAYIELEITNDCNCSCNTCPRTHLMKRPVQHIDIDKFKSFIDEIDLWCEDAFIAFSLMGEPTLHPNIMEMIEYTLEKEKLSLILETNGLFLSKEQMDRFAAFNQDKFYVIISLDSPSPEMYEQLRESKDFHIVEQNVSYLFEKKQKNTYIQILRLKENEELLDIYYKKWDAYKENIILQKYNPYRGEMEDRRGADLSPLSRFACCHLKRDMAILSDGTAAFCKQDVNGEQSFGNVFEESIEAIWNKMENAFVEDHKGNIAPYCENCDEWFTYNF